MLDEAALAKIAEYFKRAGREMLEVQKKQAFLPRSCGPLDNPVGTAPGFAHEPASEAGACWYFMPGVPHEMARMLREQVVPRLKKRLPLPKTRALTWSTQFTAEGALQEKLTAIEKRLPAGFEVTYRTRFPENHIGLYATGARLDDAEFERVAADITAALGADVFTTARDDAKLASLEETVVAKLREKRLVLSTVESCTGGLVANRLTDVAGSSDVFWGAHVTYDNSAKEALGVPQELLARHGAVSAEVARALAEAGLRKMAAHAGRTAKGSPICIATTGIAGPGGGTDEKPVGLCYLGLAREGRETQVLEIRGRRVWGRLYMKTFFAQKALDAVRRNLTD
ncbi:MAG: nicotinamide-nucleotide amidohydrolase family protein [Deltaproteobacteria bacterium]|nr:nicotinamide-nucleotide amidohydrolase family protein [Deltaproteobacteria bacterium]